MGVDAAFDLYSLAGAGFAHHICNVFNKERPNLVPSQRDKPECV